jgi:L-ascorbate metabolism protein UlaG (beta-lactamase superfamily)
MQLTHLGHSCLLVEIGSERLLIDPGAFTAGFEDLRDLDAILITHQHVDHLDLERLPALVAANPGVRLLAEPSTVTELTGVGLDGAPLQPGAKVELGSARVEVVGGDHALIHPDIPRVGNVGLLISAEGDPRLFHPGDSYGTVPEGVDILAIPINAPWTSIRETVTFARDIGAPTAVPIHDAVVSPIGRALYLRLIGSLVHGTEIRDLAGQGAVAW